MRAHINAGSWFCPQEELAVGLQRGVSLGLLETANAPKLTLNELADDASKVYSALITRA